MTSVHFKYVAPGPDGALAPIDAGVLRCALHHRDTDDTAFRVVQRIDVELVAGEATIDLQATAAGQAWIVLEQDIHSAKDHCWAIPDSEDTLEAVDLQEIDPKTLQPVTDVAAAWSTAYALEHDRAVQAETDLADMITAERVGGRCACAQTWASMPSAPTMAAM